MYYVTIRFSLLSYEDVIIKDCKYEFLPCWLSGDGPIQQGEKHCKLHSQHHFTNVREQWHQKALEVLKQVQGELQQDKKENEGD